MDDKIERLADDFENERRLSRDLFQDPDMSDDAIREFWREWGQETGISPTVVDG